MYKNRFTPLKNWKSILFKDSLILQSAELNEMQSIQSHELSSIASAILEDGAILKGGGISFQNGIAKIEESLVFAMGYTFTVPKAELLVKGNKRVEIGFLVSKTILTANDEMELLGTSSGTAALNEAGADRLVFQAEWAVLEKSGGMFFPIFVIDFGILSSVKHLAPELEGMRKLVGRYDFDSNGSYVVSGLLTTYDRDTEEKSHLLSISEGIGHVSGRELVFEYAQKVKIDKADDYRLIRNEPFIFENGKSYAFRHNPLHEVVRCVGLFETEETLSHGSYFGAKDRVSRRPLLKVLSVKQGKTTYLKDKDYVQDGDTLSWLPNGAEPAPGSSYVVRYQYHGAVTPQIRGGRFTLKNLVAGSRFYVDYTYYLTRVDRISLTEEGEIAVRKGEPSEYNAVPPSFHHGLSLATVKLVAKKKPLVEIDFFRAYKNSDIQQMAHRLDAMEYNIAKLSLDSSARSFDPTTTKKEIFVDPFLNNDLRDNGVPQNATLQNGWLENKIGWKEHLFSFNKEITLPFESSVFVEQDSYSKERLVNSYISSIAPVNKITLVPSTYRWISESVFVSGSRNVTTVSTSNKTHVVPKTKIKIVASSFTNEWVKIYLDERYIKRVKATRFSNGNYGIDTEIETPKDLTNGSKLMLLVGESSGIELKSVWYALAQKRVVVFRWRDPLAQTILFSSSRFVSALSLFVVKRPISWLKVHIVKTTVGIPNMQNSVMSKLFEAKELREGWQKLAFETPVFLEKDVEYAIVIEAGDAIAKVATAELGGYDKNSKKWITKANYAGVLLSSSNSSSWTPHQKEDLTFKLFESKFKKYLRKEIGRVVVEKCTDIGLLCDVTEYVGTSSSFVAFLVYENRKIVISPNSSLTIEPYSGEIVFSVELKSSNGYLSSVVERDILFTTGEVQSSTYVSREFILSGSSISVYLDIEEPSGSLVEVYAEDKSGKFLKLERDNRKTKNIGNGVLEVCFAKEHLSLLSTRIKIVLIANEERRPRVKNLRTIIH